MINLLNLGTVTSWFGLRESPTAGASSNHKGIDIVLKNKNIPAVISGEVTASGYNESMGNYISVQDRFGNTQTYMHMAKASPYKTGDTVTEGQIIGREGSTGVSTGSHLHFQVVDKAGNFLDPAEWFTGTGKVDLEDGKGELKWWGDIVKVVLAGLLVLCGVIMLVLAVKGDLKNVVGGIL